MAASQPAVSSPGRRGLPGPADRDRPGRSGLAHAMQQPCRCEADHHRLAGHGPGDSLLCNGGGRSAHPAYECAKSMRGQRSYHRPGDSLALPTECFSACHVGVGTLSPANMRPACGVNNSTIGLVTQLAHHSPDLRNSVLQAQRLSETSCRRKRWKRA